MPIPAAVAAKALFAADRTCCVCRTHGKPVQIHHIDSNHLHNAFENLAVLCLECHSLTQLLGGFHRRLDPDQVKLYRSDWLESVAAGRQLRRNVAQDSRPELDLELVTSIVERLRECGEWELLAKLFHTLGHAELRDKYIEKALNVPSLACEREVYLRSLKGADGLQPAQVKRAAAAMLGTRDFTSLARMMLRMQCARESLRAYCQGILEKLAQNEVFHAACLAKELQEKELPLALFSEELERFTSRGELWWQVRCLQELGHHDQLRRILLENRSIIESGEDELLKMELYRALDDTIRFRSVAKRVFGGAEQLTGAVVRLGRA